MARRGGRRGRGGARGGRGRTRSTRDTQMSSPSNDGEPGAKKSKKDAAEEEMSDFLAQPAHILIQIVNNLDPKSFRELAFSCKALFDFCLKTKGISIVFDVRSVEVEIDDDDYFKTFRWKIWIWSKSFSSGKEKKIPNLTHGPPVTLEEVKKAAEFVKAFGVSALYFSNAFYGVEIIPEDIFEASLQMPVLELEMHVIDDRFGFDSIMKCTIPSMYVEARIQMEQFEAIVKVWMIRNDLRSWKFDFSSDSIMDYFVNWDICPFIYVGPVDPIRPTVFMRIDSTSDSIVNSFFIRRQDGNVLLTTQECLEGRTIEFSLCPVANVPPALTYI